MFSAQPTTKDYIRVEQKLETDIDRKREKERETKTENERERERERGRERKRFHKRTTSYNSLCSLCTRVVQTGAAACNHTRARTSLTPRTSLPLTPVLWVSGDSQPVAPSHAARPHTGCPTGKGTLQNNCMTVSRCTVEYPTFQSVGMT